MPVHTEQQGEALRYTLCPNRSLDWRTTKRVFLGFAACMGAFSAYWVAQGAWLVLPFFGLELLVLGLGLYLSALAASRREVVEIDGAELRVLRGGRRLEQVECLPRYWSRVVLSTDPRGWYASRLWLVSHGRRVQVGASLVEPERLELAAELTRQLGLNTAIFHRRPEPVVTGAAAPAPPSTTRGDMAVSTKPYTVAGVVAGSLLTLGAALWAGAARAELGINFPEPAAGVAQEIYNIHMLTTTIATVLLVIIFGFVIYSLIHHRKSRGYVADQNFHQSWFGHWSWVIVPVLVLGVDLTIAHSAQKTLEKVWEVPKGEDMLDVKVVGHQWWWEYEYLDHSVEIDGKPQVVRIESRATTPEQAGEHYLRDVDNALVLPVGQKVRFLHTSADVNHAFWVPELAVKKDAIPGYVTETWVDLNREGTFRGQCAELCGTWHSRMPIVVESVSQEKFDSWMEGQKQTMLAAAAEASMDKTWSMEELMEKGQAAYNTKCGACHQINGKGLPPAFPALAGSKIATGPIAGHLDIVLNGKPGTAMVAWNTLSDLELAAIITYERNAWGNDTGDLVQPRDIKAARSVAVK